MSKTMLQNAERHLNSLVGRYQFFMPEPDVSTRRGRSLAHLLAQCDFAREVAHRVLAQPVEINDARARVFLELADLALETDHLLTLAARQRLIPSPSNEEQRWAEVDQAVRRCNELTGRIAAMTQNLTRLVFAGV
ncbi:MULTISPECIES: hypothetical protein [unclassified Crossiella]|uniref:hypothetical protein n=1 Tax=unclassified Crossiella TaxID=2620835 RepID=UPI001FFF3F5E|nr:MULTISPECIES: hypothetical protein [unclassified Crossiella]MCK2245269.1 hypothetical protein [Crossiella sp. S99.2]MCK2258922.1 hypothetical protein [Crossiella sp. S99.1]